MKVAIIEDEKLTAHDLAKTLRAVEPDIEIMQVLTSVEEAVEFFRTAPPLDLIFSDIELGDGLSFEIFEQCPINTPIIFCTAYDHYALKAFGTVGIDYILKPFSKNSIEKTLLKYQQFKNSFQTNNATPANPYEQLLKTLQNQLISKTPSVLITQGDKIIPLNSQQIALFFVEGDYTFVYTFDQKTHLVQQTLEHWEKTLTPTFFRANRQFLVNRKAIKDASHHFNRKLAINLNVPFKENIIISKLKVTPFLEWLVVV
jgi:two-component system response regulator LytT